MAHLSQKADNLIYDSIELTPYIAEDISTLAGPCNEIFKFIEKMLKVSIYQRANSVTVHGQSKSHIDQAICTISQAYKHVCDSHSIDTSTIQMLLQEAKHMTMQTSKHHTKQNHLNSQKESNQPLNASHQTPSNEHTAASKAEEAFAIITKRGSIKPRTPNQKSYIQSIRKNDINFGIGAAGTGKTYLAVACAIEALLKGDIEKILLVRPAVEAGEKLGFLPGDLEEKINPYLRPLFDALQDMLGAEKMEKLIERNIIEIAPLAYMRGRTLNNSFIILDEAQNTTPQQMKMFLTRMGFNSKIVVNGDKTQIDLPYNQPSGLINALNILEGVKGISFTHFNSDDIVRHPLVQAIVNAYEKRETNNQSRQK